MDAWAIQDAKARFSESLEACINEGPQLVTKRGTAAAVLVRVDEWERLQAGARPTLKGLLLAEEPRIEFELPQRGRVQPRSKRSGG